MTVCLLLAALSQVGGTAVVPTTAAAATSVSLATRRTCAHAPRASRRSTTPTVPKVSILHVKKGCSDLEGETGCRRVVDGL